MTAVFSKPRALALAVMAALATSIAYGQTTIPLIKDAVNASDLRTDPVELKTFIYSTTNTAGTDYNGYLLIDVAEGASPPSSIDPMRPPARCTRACSTWPAGSGSCSTTGGWATARW